MCFEGAVERADGLESALECDGEYGYIRPHGVGQRGRDIGESIVI